MLIKIIKSTPHYGKSVSYCMKTKNKNDGNSISYMIIKVF